MRPLLLNEVSIALFISTIVRIKLQWHIFFIGWVELDCRFKVDVLGIPYTLLFKLTSRESDLIETALVPFDEIAANLLSLLTIFVLLS